MPLSRNPDPADPDERRYRHLPPKTYAAAAEEALDPHWSGAGFHDGPASHATKIAHAHPSASNGHSGTFDEDSIKETPPRPRSSGRRSTSPRPFGEMIDEAAWTSPPSPTLHHTTGRVEKQASRESYADAVKHSVPPASSKSVELMKHVNGSNGSIERPSMEKMPGSFDGWGLDDRTGTFDGAGDDDKKPTMHKTHEQATSESRNEAGQESVLQEQQAQAAPTEVGEQKQNPPHAVPDEQKQDPPHVEPKEQKQDPSHAEPKEQKSSQLQQRNDKEQLGPDHTPERIPKLAPQSEEADNVPQQGYEHGKEKESSKGDPKPEEAGKAGSEASREASHVAESEPKQSQRSPQQPGQVFYENLRNKSGENLASIAPSADYSFGMTRHSDEAPSSEPPSDQLPKHLRVKPAHTRSQSELVSGRHAGAGWSRSAIRWAPANVPLQRRLQTLLVLLHTLSIAGGLALFFLLCTIPLLWPLLLPYLIYVLLSRASISGELSHRSPTFRGLKIWSLFAGYFPARLHRSAILEPTRKYIFGYHPHGIISHGAFAAFATEALGFSQLFPGITNTLLTLDSNFRIPLYRDYALRMGLASVSRESCENILSRGGPNNEGMGRAITIVVGGARESLDAKPKTLRLVLKRRKGFVKLAIRTGADLVPVLAFGENDLYDQFDAATHPHVHKAQLTVKKFLGFTIPLFHARGVFNYDVGLMPYRRPINIVVGRPIPILQASQPDPEYIDAIHERYVKELERLWEEWKDTFARHREGELEIVE